MTRDDIIRMAREVIGAHPDQEPLMVLNFEQCERFAALVAAAEREACARFVEEGYMRQFENPWREDLAAAIRARGQA